MNYNIEFSNYHWGGDFGKINLTNANGSLWNNHDQTTRPVDT